MIPGRALNLPVNGVVLPFAQGRATGHGAIALP